MVYGVNTGDSRTINPQPDDAPIIVYGVWTESDSKSITYDNTIKDMENSRFVYGVYQGKTCEKGKKTK